MKQERYLLCLIVDLFRGKKERFNFAQSVTTPMLGGKVVNIAYFLIIKTGRM